MQNYGHAGKTAVVALGGNAIERKGEKGDIHAQFANTRDTTHLIIDLLKRGYRLVITHGNGPQVGDRLIQVEAAIDQVPDIPLGVLVADTQGGMGYMIEQCLHNVMRREYGIRLPHVATVITQVIVDRADPELQNPSKPIGPFFDAEQAQRLMQGRGWSMREDKARGGWRRVVPSPIPRHIVEKRTIRALLDAGFIVIAAGGGGIPVYREADGWLEGVDAVVDKDRASALVADMIEAEELLILTDVDAVAVNFKTPTQRFLSNVTVSELQAHQADGQFPPGSMGPKVQAALDFLTRTPNPSRKVLITSIARTIDALNGQAGTWITPDNAAEASAPDA